MSWLERRGDVRSGETVTSMRHVVVPYGAGNSTVRTRSLHWIERLERSGTIPAGSVVVHGPGWARRSIPAGSDVLLLRNARRFTRGRVERSLLQRAGLGVYDLDDGLPWDDGRLPGLGRWWKRPWPRALVARRAAAAGDRVVVGNAVLADWAAGVASDVRVIPTCVEPADYHARTSWDVAGSEPVIGWIGSPATEPYLWDVRSALVEVHRRTGARLHVISGDGGVPDTLAGFTRRSTWSVSSSHELLSSWDVGIMPLRDGVYERAKCGYKLLQYAAAGVPAAGRPGGVNRSILAAMDGLAPESHDDWVEALCALVEESPARRASRAAAGLEVADDHSYDRWESAWVDAVGWRES